MTKARQSAAEFFNSRISRDAVQGFGGTGSQSAVRRSRDEQRHPSRTFGTGRWRILSVSSLMSPGK